MRFRAPLRDEVDRVVFEHPVFAAFAPWSAALHSDAWPTLDNLNEALENAWATASTERTGSSSVPRFGAQTAELLDDGLHYEQRIATCGVIATREANWHDLLNALIWLRYPQMKRSLNARQVADIGRVGVRQRTRAQDALTQFDEAGVILSIRADAGIEDLVDAWNRHAWTTFFRLISTSAWSIEVIGHALLEHALFVDRLLVGKAIMVVDTCKHSAVDLVAERIESGCLLTDPQDLRPLPLMGLPGWHSRAGESAFYAEAACFQPVRAGRRYPSPLTATYRAGERSRLCADD